MTVDTSPEHEHRLLSTKLLSQVCSNSRPTCQHLKNGKSVEVLFIKNDSLKSRKFAFQ